MKFINWLKKIESALFWIGLCFVGLVFAATSILTFLGVFATDSSIWVTIAFLVVGLAAAYGGYIMSRKTISKSVADYNHLDKVDINMADEETIRQIRESDEEEHEYYFHFTGKMNQSYIMETPDTREAVWEARCDSFNAFKPYEYTFINHLTGSEKACKISHTMENSTGDEFSSIIVSSYFKIDDENIWTHIGRLGFSMKPYLDDLAVSYEVFHYGVKVAEIAAAGREVFEKYENSGGIKVGNGLYKIECRDSDIDDIGLIAFAVGRTHLF